MAWISKSASTCRSDDEALARRIEAQLDRPAYARVDLVPTQAGPLLMELELIEPSLFFRMYPESAQRLADTVLALTPV